MSRIQVKVNSKIFEEWEKVTINRTLNNMCGSFSMLLYYDYTDGTSTPPPLSGRIQISHLDDFGFETKVMTGYIDDVNSSIAGPTGLMLEISGRDITCDMIDSTVETSISELNELTVSDALQQLIAPFNITLSSTSSKLQNQVKKKAQSPDEKVGAIISTICKKVGVLPLTDENGDLIVEDKVGGTISGGLQMGVNILNASHNASHRNRYSQITVLGNGDNELSELAVSGGSTAEDGVAIDSSYESSRRRVLTVIGSNVDRNDKGALEEEANWKMAMSRASVSKVKIKVHDWLTTDSGELYKVNRLINCDLSRIGLSKSNMLISSITFEMDKSSGTFTNMQLIHEDAYNDKTFESKDSDKLNVLSVGS